MKNLFFFSFMLLALLFPAQNTFEYERVWGTYFGPGGGQTAGIFYPKGILFDSQEYMHFDGNLLYAGQAGAAYYNLFVMGGGLPYNPSASGYFDVRFTPFGSPDYFGYIDSGAYSRLVAIDHQDNRYRIYGGSSIPVQATPGTFMPTAPQSSSDKVLLAKYSPAGVLLWATYLPSIVVSVYVITDPAGNVYISGSTTLMQNLATPGVWQSIYDEFYDSNGHLVPNGYLLKLNGSGQRIWGTYTPGRISVLRYYDGNLYAFTGRNTNPALDTMATSGAFQVTPSDLSLTRIDAGSGLRIWGTYYGPAVNAFELAEFSDLEVNETGIYLTGTDHNYQNSNYFGTPGSYRPQISGGSEIFLSKFSHAGQREWSTYFGHSGADENMFDKSLALQGNNVYITGTAFGPGNNIATAGAYQTAPEQNIANGVNFYFAKFNSSGNLVWCSYYGGTSTFGGYPFSLNIAVKGNSLILSGSTNSNTGFATENAWMPQRNPDNQPYMTPFIARFNDVNQMGTSESVPVHDLRLYNNPNDGNFSLTGSALTKESCFMKIYDAAGRQIHEQKLSRQKTQHFHLQGKLPKGNYLVEVTDSSSNPLKVFKMVVSL